MTKGEDIQERLTGLAISALNFCKAMPRSPMGIHVSGQLMRCATSPASNYAEARVSESRRDFVHKLGIVLKELNQSRMWFRFVVETGLLPQAMLRAVQTECDELCKIVYSSRRTAASRLANTVRYGRPS